jgi:hypothetical protein
VLFQLFSIIVIHPHLLHIERLSIQFVDLMSSSSKGRSGRRRQEHEPFGLLTNIFQIVYWVNNRSALGVSVGECDKYILPLCCYLHISSLLVRMNVGPRFSFTLHSLQLSRFECCCLFGCVLVWKSMDVVYHG